MSNISQRDFAGQQLLVGTFLAFAIPTNMILYRTFYKIRLKRKLKFDPFLGLTNTS